MTLGKPPFVGPVEELYVTMGPPGRKYKDPGSHADRIASDIVNAAIAVHQGLGPGYPESTYESALAIELDHREIAYQRQVPYEARYRDVVVGGWRLDLLVEEWVIVEVKSVERLVTLHTLQALTYLRITELPLALLINFNVGFLRDGIRRVVPPVL